MKAKSAKYLVYAVLLAVSNGAYAGDYTSTVTLNNGSTLNFVGDTTITANSGNGLDLYKTMGVVTIDPGAKLNVVATADGATSGAGIRVKGSAQSGDAIITLGETHITSMRSGIYVTVAADSQYTTKIKLGDNSSIKSKSLALNIDGRSTIEIGKNATIIGIGHGGSVATVQASNGAKIIFDDGVKITNTAETDINGTNYNAVLAYHTNSSNGEKAEVRIGNSAVIKTLAKGYNNHAIKAGSTEYFNGSGEVTVGDNAAISTVGKTSYGLYAAYEGSLIELGTNALITTEGEEAAAVRSGVEANAANGLAGAGGKIFLGESTTIKTSGKDASGLEAKYVGSEIITGQKVDIETIGNNSYAVNAIKGGKISLAGGKIVSQQSHAVYAADKGDGDSSAIVVGSGKFDIKGYWR